MSTDNGTRGAAEDKTTAPAAEPAEPAQPAVKPEPVDFDLDALEVDGHRTDPFKVRLGGEVYEFISPKEMDWQDLMVAQRNAYMFVRYALGEDRYKSFLTHRIPEAKMEKMVVAYFKHFGMTESPELRALLG